MPIFVAEGGDTTKGIRHAVHSTADFDEDAEDKLCDFLQACLRSTLHGVVFFLQACQDCAEMTESSTPCFESFYTMEPSTPLHSLQSTPQSLKTSSMVGFSKSWVFLSMVVKETLW